MRWWRTRASKAAAAGGVMALACNAAVPVFLAFVLAAALAPAHRFGAGEWRSYGLLCHHQDDNGNDPHGKPAGAPCPVCSLHGVLAAALPAPAAAPPVPTAFATFARHSAAIVLSRGIVHSGYRSRAPPIA